MRHHGRRFPLLLALALLLPLVVSGAIRAAPTSSDDASKAVTGLLNLDNQPLGMS